MDHLECVTKIKKPVRKRRKKTKSCWLNNKIKKACEKKKKKTKSCWLNNKIKKACEKKKKKTKSCWLNISWVRKKMSPTVLPSFFITPEHSPVESRSTVAGCEFCQPYFRVQLLAERLKNIKNSL